MLWLIIQQMQQERLAKVRPICWLHVSDIHLRARDAWSQDVVLKAMCNHIERQRAEGTAVDFVLVTGDIAFSGKETEYAMAADFLDALGAAAGVPKARIFCIPGNHDIDRDRQNLCFKGARAFLVDHNRVDELLAGGEDLETLLKRQENYRNFQKSYFTAQDKQWTADGLAYVARLTVEDVRLAVLGMDSAWLAMGGQEDHGSLLIGERQIINAINLVQGYTDAPHIVIGMAHHPFHLLREFDRRSAQSRIERACRFFHCGHLHEPESRASGHGAGGCLTLSAGASFETRQSQNTYSVVTVDLLSAKRTVKTVQYSPGIGTFSFASTDDYPIEITSPYSCPVGELAKALEAFHAATTPLAHYLAALLLNQKAELPIPARNGYTFGSYDLLQAQDDGELKRKALAFTTFRNALNVLYKRIDLSDLLAKHGAVVVEYGTALLALRAEQPGLKARLDEYERDARALADTEPQDWSSHTDALLAELAEAGDWALLREQAQRHTDSSDPRIALEAKRMLALALANSTEEIDKSAAIDLYQSLVVARAAKVSDLGNLALLLLDAGHTDQAKAIVLDGINRSPANQNDHLLQVGRRIVEASGDREFRKQMDEAQRAGGKHG